MLRLTQTLPLEILNVYEKTYRFNDVNNIDPHVYCDVVIEFKKIKVVDDLFYEINYTYKFPPYVSRKHWVKCSFAHPFYYRKNVNDTDKKGVTININPLTDKLIEYLSMEPEELEKIPGVICWMKYKIKIMESLLLFKPLNI